MTLHVLARRRSAAGAMRLTRICELFGMAVHMYWFDRQKHDLPHFHVRHQGEEAVFDLSGRVLDGDVGPRAARLVAEWCAERSAELERAWACADSGKELPWIAPLR